MAIEEKASIDTLLIAAEVLERDVIKPDKSSRSGGRDHYAVNGLSEQVFRSIPYHGETFKNMANMDRRNPGSAAFLSNSRSQLAPFVPSAAEKRWNSSITPPYFSMNDPYRQSAAAAAAAADLLYPDLSSLAAVGATLPQDWLKSLSPQRSSGSKWALPPASTSSRTSVPMPSTSTSFSESGEWNPAFNRRSPTLPKTSAPLNFMGLHDLPDRTFVRGSRHGGSSTTTFNGFTSSVGRPEADSTKSATSSPAAAAVGNVPHKRLRTALLADRPGALLENRTNGRALSDVTAPWMTSAAASASATRSLVISRDITTSAGGGTEPHRSSQTSAVASHANSLPNATVVSPSTTAAGCKHGRQAESPVETTTTTVPATGSGNGGAPTIVKPSSTAPRLPAKKRKIDWSFSDDPPVMPPLKDRSGAKLSLPCGLDGAQRIRAGGRQGSPLQTAATAAGGAPVAPLIVDRPAAVGLALDGDATTLLNQSHLLLLEQARRKQSEPFLLSSSSSLDAALHRRSPPVRALAVGEVSGTPAPPPPSAEAPPAISTHLPTPQPLRRKLSYPNLLDHMSFNYDASLFLSQLQRQSNLEAGLQAPLRGEARKEECGLRTPLVVDVSSDEPRRVKHSQESGPTSRHHPHHPQQQQQPKPPPPMPDVPYSRVDYLKAAAAAAAAEPMRPFSLAANVVAPAAVAAPADGARSRQHRHSSISPPQLHHLQQLQSLYLHPDYSQMSPAARSPANASKTAASVAGNNTGRSLLISRSLEKPTAAAAAAVAAVSSPLSSQPPTPVKARPFSAPQNTGSAWPAAASSALTTSAGYPPRNLTTALTTDASPTKPGSGAEPGYDATFAAAAAIAALSQANRDPPPPPPAQPRERFSGFQVLAAASNATTAANEQQLRAGHPPSVQGTALSPGRDSKSAELVHQLALGGLANEQAYYRKRSLDSLFTHDPRFGASAAHNTPVGSISDYFAAAAAGASRRSSVQNNVASGFPLLLFSAPSSASAAALAAETALEWGASPTSLIPVPVEIKSLPSGFLSGKRRHEDEDDEGEDGQREAFTFISTNLPNEDSAGSSGSGNDGADDSGGGRGNGGAGGGAGGRSSGQPAPQLIFPVLSSSLRSGSLKKACALGLPMLVPPNAQDLLVNKPKSV